MALAYTENFARVTRVDGRRVELEFDLDRARWPWLALPPLHPVLLEKYQYFGILTGFLALSGTDPAKQTALTGISWRCLEPETVALASAGVLTHRRDDGHESLELELLVESGETLVTIDAVGVVFATRDFGAWRAKTRAEAQAATDVPAMPPLAPAEAVGLGPGGRAFVSALREVDGQLGSMALVGDDAFHPRHPFHTGSGDHVNAGHLFDCALQAAHLVLDSASPRSCEGGSAKFFRYVELGVPFELLVVEREAERVGFAVRQLGREAARITLTLGSAR